MERQDENTSKYLKVFFFALAQASLVGALAGCDDEVSSGVPSDETESDGGSTSTPSSSSGSGQVATGDGTDATTTGNATESGTEADTDTDTDADTDTDTDDAVPMCGNGVLEGDEACDDGEDNSDSTPDACRTDCRRPVCGDGVIDSREACDDGAANNDEAPDACRTNCGVASCGDGVVDLGEECDNGAANDDTTPDACRTNCLNPGCGDAVTDADEGCDDGNANSDDTPDACRTTCQPSGCGDAVVDSGEGCDDGEANDDAAPDACRTNCQPAGCGDGIVDAGETCDDGNAVTEICDYGEACTVCTDACVEGPGEEQFCGDGVLNGPEECDDGLGNDDSTTDACRTSCLAPACQDAVVDTGEECDDGNADDLDGCESDCSFICESTVAVASGADRSYLDGDTCYLAHATPASWDAARVTCSENAGVLVLIDDGVENSLVRTMSDGPDLWIGYSDIDSEGEFAWLEGPSTFENWNSPEPNNFLGAEDCALMRIPNGNWNDFSCLEERAFVCEMTACGNGEIDEGESCDDGNAVTDSCNYGVESGCTVCGFGCVDAPGMITFCGDGITDAANGEGCDDGGSTALDGCDDACAIEAGAACLDTEPSVCYIAAVSATALELSIPDNAYNGSLASMACASVSVTATGDDLLDTAAVELGIDHSYIGDLVVKLVHPGGTVVTLTSRPGFGESSDDGTGGFGTNANLLSSAPVSFHTGGTTDAEQMGGGNFNVCADNELCDYAPNPGAATPGGLDSLIGLAASGTWELCVGDAAAGDVGSLESFALLYTE